MHPIMKQIKSKDEGYELATIAEKHDLDGDTAIDFLMDVIKEYNLDNEPVDLEAAEKESLGQAPTDFPE